MDFQQLLKFAVDNGASDIHLQAGSPPVVRIAGQMRSTTSPAIADEELRGFVLMMMPERLRAGADREIVRGLDFSADVPSLARFRCSAFSQLGRFGMVMRLVKSKIPTVDELNLPKVMKEIALVDRGLTLVTGTTGSGKSTTLATMIDLVNDSYHHKIIAIEDPIEYLHPNRKSLISQLELGGDTPSFDQALRQALRQDPDVILVGELRDVDTLRMALRAADTGHRVLSTVHSSNAPQTVERIIAMFPQSEHDLLLHQLAGSIEAIISQRLVVGIDGKRRPAVEILRGSPVTEKFIAQKKLSDLHTYMESREAGMQTFDQHLLRMYQEEKAISGTEALRAATNPEALGMAMRGIRTIGGKSG